MKKLIAVLSLALLAGCTTRTEYGDCVGIGDDKNPKLTYKISVWNAVLGVIFFELIVPPVMVVADSLYCPVGTKDGK